MTEAIRAQMIEELQHAGWLQQVLWLDEIDSTNSHARRLTIDGQAPLPMLVLADRQICGRGRSDHQWWSPEGCLMMTLALSEDQLPKLRASWSMLSLVVGVAVADAVNKVLPHSKGCQLKWPNDVYVVGKKLGGILVETFQRPVAAALDVGKRQEKSSEQVFLIGIGLNVAVDWTLAPEGLAEKATCISQVVQEAVDRAEVLAILLRSLQSWLEDWRADRRDWLGGWLDRCMLTGRVVRIQAANCAAPGESEAILTGRCEGISSSGSLIIRTEQEVLEISAGEVIEWSR